MVSSPSRILLVLLVASCSSIVSCEDQDWNNKIAWVDTWDNALAEAQKTSKPVFLLVHRLWCGACKSLRPRFAESKEIEALSEKFVMINSHDESLFNGAPFVPDGGYIPRILFFTPKGDLMEIQAKRDKNLYFYPGAEQVLDAMNRALKLYSQQPQDNQEEEEEKKTSKNEL